MPAVLLVEDDADTREVVRALLEEEGYQTAVAADGQEAIDHELLRRRYFEKPDPADPQQRVSFGTSGHRGSSLRGSFNEAHILAVTQAICEYRKTQGTTGPLYLGADTHGLSDLAQRTGLEVLA